MINNEEFKKVCLNISKYRIKNNLSAYELSMKIGKDTSYISKLENGKVNVTFSVLVDICNVFKIKVIDLLK